MDHTMHPVARLRFVLARHRWIHWTVVAALAAAVATGVAIRLGEVDRARDRWGETVEVFVATDDQDAGTIVEAERVVVPAAIVPVAALREPPAGARLVQRVTRGEILVDADVTVADGPAALAPAGTLVVGIVDPTGAAAAIGQRVRVGSEGIVTEHVGTVVDRVDDVVYVAVDADDASLVSAAAQAGTATLLFVP